MKTNKSTVASSRHSYGDVRIPIPALVGPLLGLVYIMALPFVGITAFILASSYRATQSLATMYRRATQATVDAQEWAMAETVAVGSRDFIQLIIDGLECELVVVNRELRISQYYVPLLRQNKLLEQTAIGQHCFEVSHGSNTPCESCECECPVRKVLETNKKVTVNHYHENPPEGKGRQKLVRVLALPVRDSQGNITQVAELIWDADNLKQEVFPPRPVRRI